MNKVVTNPNDQWLVKSANRVMGPFKLVEVVTGLHLKHFTIMDEISSPFGRWLLIRDEPSLQAAVKEIRNRSDTNEHTTTQTMTSTMTGTITKGVGEMQESKVRDVPPPLMPGSLDPKLIKDSKLLQAMRKKSGPPIWLFVFIGLLLGGGGFYFFQMKKMKNPVFDQIAAAIKLKEYGFYERSFNQLLKLRSGAPNNPSLEMNLGVFQIALQGQNILGRKAIEKILGDLDSPKEIATAHTAIGLSYLKEGDFNGAGAAFDKANAADPQFVSAHVNRAILDYKKGNAEKAEQDLEPVIGQVNNGLVILGSTLASLEVNRKGMMPMRILPVLVQMLDDYLKNNFEYQQEIYMLKAFIYTSLGKSQQRQDAVLELLNSDLESGEGHAYDLLVDRSVFDWKNLVPFCQGTAEMAPSDILSRSFLAFCYVKAGNGAEARKIISEAEAQAPRDPHVAAIKAYIMKSMGQDGAAKASLAIAAQEKEILSTHLMLARFCEREKNETCTYENYKELMNFSSRNLPAHVGLAAYELRKGRKKEAREWVMRGQGLSTTYIPLWDLKTILN